MKKQPRPRLPSAQRVVGISSPSSLACSCADAAAFLAPALRSRASCTFSFMPIFFPWTGGARAGGRRRPLRRRMVRRRCSLAWTRRHLCTSAGPQRQPLQGVRRLPPPGAPPTGPAARNCQCTRTMAAVVAASGRVEAGGRSVGTGSGGQGAGKLPRLEETAREFAELQLQAAPRLPDCRVGRRQRSSRLLPQPPSFDAVRLLQEARCRNGNKREVGGCSRGEGGSVVR